MNKNIVIGVLLVAIGVFAYLYFKPKDQPVVITPVEEIPVVKEEEKKTEEAPTQKLENITTPLFIKSMYQKNGQWYADVDYYSYSNALEITENRIRDGICVLPNMTIEKALAYVKTVQLSENSTNSVKLEDSLLQKVDGCYVDAETMIYFAPILNINPMIRTFPFSTNFKISNQCRENQTLNDLVKLVNSGSYSYDKYNTNGVNGMIIQKATITNSTITSFDTVRGCAG